MKTNLTLKLVIAIAFSLSIYSANAQTQTPPVTTTVNNITVNGDMVVEDVTVTKDTLRAKEDIIAEHDVKVGGDLEVNGKIDFAGSGTTDISITYKAATPTKNYSTLNFGPPLNSIASNAAATIDPSSLPACFSLNNNNGQFSLGTQPQNNIFSGLIRSYNLNGTQSSMLTIGNTGWGSSMIESEGNYQGSATATGLMINYFCGRNTYINTGNANGGSAAGGWVYMGDQVSMRKHVEIGDPIWMISDANNVALDINAGGGKGIVFNTWNTAFPVLSVRNTNYTGSDLSLYGGGMAHFGGNVQIGFPASQNTIQDNSFLLNLNTNGTPIAKNGIKFSTWDNSVKLMDLVNANTGAGFTVFGNGQTYIGKGKPKAGSVVQNAMLSVEGTILAKAVYIAVNSNYWADYVFDKSYKLLPINDLKKFIQSEKHLPGVPSGQELEKNGLSIHEMSKIQMEKIEELYLYILKQQDEINALKAIINKTN